MVENILSLVLLFFMTLFFILVSQSYNDFRALENKSEQ